VRATDTRLHYATHEDCLLHEPFPGHPERPRRLQAALAGATLAGAERVPVSVNDDAVLEAVARVHSPTLAGRLREACKEAPRTFDCEDNPISAGTYRAAIAAVATCLAAADRVVTGSVRKIFAAVRPPGHHALRDRAMGFCYFNNAAIATEALLAAGIGPVAIVDLDAHHGNGTQQHFYARSDVFYLSLHCFPAFPGSGAGDETGSGDGAGFTRNLPLAAGAGDEIYREALVTGVTDLLAAMAPAVWVVSAGFDAHRDDPLGHMNVSDAGFFALGRVLSGMTGGSPLLALLEGGYDLKALQRSVCAFLSGLSGHAAS
jgi:acetoin utilization deacetylase AcuC-like enzyme